MQELILRGSSFDQGVTMGKAFGDRIRARAATHERVTPQTDFSSEDERASEFPPSDDPTLYLAQCAELMFYLQEHVPDLIELMHGMARGAGCAFEDIFRLNCQRGIAGTRPRANIFQSCSSVAGMTEDAGMVLSRTGDCMVGAGKPKPSLPGVWDDDWAVFMVVPEHGMRHILFGSADILVAGDAMNEAGVSFACVNLPYGPLRVGGGVPYNLVTRAIAPRAESVEHALEILSGWRQASRAKGWPMVDAAGACLAVEKCFDRTGVAKPSESGVLAHANDYLSPEMQDLADHDQNSADRVRTLEKHVRQAQVGGGVTVAAMEAAVRLHTEAGSICRHGEPNRSDGGGFTSTAAVYLPEQRKMRVMCGDHPCRAEFHELDFDSWRV